MVTRNEIIETTIKLIKNSDNHEAITLELIRNEVGLSQGGLYHHFKNREDLFLAVYESYSENLQLKILLSIGRLLEKNLDPYSFVYEALGIFLTDYRAEKYFLPAMTQFARSNPLLKDKRTYLNSSSIELCAKYLYPVLGTTQTTEQFQEQIFVAGNLLISFISYWESDVNNTDFTIGDIKITDEKLFSYLTTAILSLFSV